VASIACVDLPETSSAAPHGTVDLRFGHPESHRTPTREWFREHENIGSPRPILFVIDTLGVFGRGGNRRPAFFK
jgi:hypothetical protein